MADELREINKGIKQLSQDIKNSFDKIGQRVGKEVSDVLTPELQDIKSLADDAVDVSKDSGKALLRFFGIGLSKDAKELKAAEKSNEELDKQTDLLKGKGPGAATAKGLKVKDVALAKMLKQQNLFAKEELKISKRKEKADRAKITGRQGAWWKNLLFWLFGVPAFAIAAAIGLVAGFIIQPFNAILKILKAAKLPELISGIVKFLASIFKIDVLAIGKLWGPGSKIATFFGWLGKTKIFSWIGNAIRWIRTNQGLIAKLTRFTARGFMAGFSKLFWPLQIILSTIDFIKGFMDQEGSILDKIQAGIKNVFVKFFSWPLKLIGKLFEWVMAKMGFEDLVKEGETGAKLIEWLGKGIDMIFTGWKLIFGLLGDSVGWLLEKMGSGLRAIDWNELKQSIVDGFKKIVGIPDMIKNWILDFFGWQEEVDPETQNLINRANAGEFNEKERRMAAAEQTARNQRTTNQVKLTTEQEDANRKLLEKIAKLQKEGNEQGISPIIIPERKQGSNISGNPDTEISIQNSLNPVGAM